MNRGTPTNSTLANVVAAGGVTSSALGPIIAGPLNNNSNSTSGGGTAAGGGAVGGAAAAAAHHNSPFLLSRVGLEMPSDDQIMTQVSLSVRIGIVTFP